MKKITTNSGIFIILSLLIWYFSCMTLTAASDNDTVSIVINAVGDCTLGTDKAAGNYYSFDSEFIKHKLDYAYFFNNVSDIFKYDDLTIANLETTLTEFKDNAEKEFCFKGKPEYAKILSSSGIDSVNLANNHTYDYLKNGYNDTLLNLKKENIGFFGNENISIYEINGTKIGMLGYKGWSNTKSIRNEIRNDIKTLRKTCQLVIISFHWGDEYSYYPNSVQKELAHYSINSGADLIIGHHPHVMQGIEKYRGKYIAYSLGNFCFGGNKNPKDKDTFILQESFTINLKTTKIVSTSINPIACSLSSVKYRNDYHPIILTGSEKKRVDAKLEKLSAGIN